MIFLEPDYNVWLYMWLLVNDLISKLLLLCLFKFGSGSHKQRDILVCHSGISIIEIFPMRDVSWEVESSRSSHTLMF